MALHVYAPLAGTIVDLQELPDPVFAQAMVGPGLAIDPATRGQVDVHSPLEGAIAALHPHAFAVETADGAALVHLGLDTVTLQGAPFEVHVEPGQNVHVGQGIITWNIGGIGGLSPLVPVVALGAKEITLKVSAGEQVDVGDPLFVIG